MNQTDRFFQILPPEVAGENMVISATTAAAAANWDWVTDLGASYPKGTVFVLLEANTSDCYVRFKAAGDTAATTALNGLLIKADQPGRPFWVDPTLHRFIDHVALAAGALKLQVASKMGARKEI